MSLTLLSVWQGLTHRVPLDRQGRCLCWVWQAGHSATRVSSPSSNSLAMTLRQHLLAPPPAPQFPQQLKRCKTIYPGCTPQTDLYLFGAWGTLCSSKVSGELEHPLGANGGVEKGRYNFPKFIWGPIDKTLGTCPKRSTSGDSAGVRGVPRDLHQILSPPGCSLLQEARGSRVSPPCKSSEGTPACEGAEGFP